MPKPRPEVAKACDQGAVPAPRSVGLTKNSPCAKQGRGPKKRVEHSERAIAFKLKALAESAVEHPSELSAPHVDATATIRLVPKIIAVKHWDRILGGELLARSPRVDWATLLHRTFAVDVRQCAVCGGPLRVLAQITDPESASRLLQALGLPTEPPPIARARDPDERHDDIDISHEDNEP